MSTKTRTSLFGPRRMAAQVHLQSAIDQIEKAKREKIAAECELWSVQMEGYGGPAQPSPTIAEAVMSGYMFLQVKCHRCSTFASINLQAMTARRSPNTQIWRLEPHLRCQKCKVATHYRPHVHLVKLTRTESHDTWYPPGEDDRG